MVLTSKSAWKNYTLMEDILGWDLGRLEFLSFVIGLLGQIVSLLCDSYSHGFTRGWEAGGASIIFLFAPDCQLSTANCAGLSSASWPTSPPGSTYRATWSRGQPSLVLHLHWVGYRSLWHDLAWTSTSSLSCYSFLLAILKKMHFWLHEKLR